MEERWQYREGPVVLVSRPIEYTFPLSYAYLAGYLLQQGEKVELIFRGRDRDALVKQIMATNPVLVGFGNLYPELPEIHDLIDLLDKAGRRFPIVIGGQMVSPIPEFAVKVTGADFAVIGEGEIILHQLVCALRAGTDPLTVKGLAIRQGDKVVLTGPGPYIEDLSKLPSIPYELFPETQWLEIGRWYNANCPQPHWRFRDRVVNVHGGRGCPYTCNFCYHHSRPRYRPVDHILAEGAEMIERFNANVLYLSDDLVLATPSRARELVNGLRKFKRPVEYQVSVRFDILNRIDDGLLREMKETGCRIMSLGLESGSDRMLKIIGKSCTSAQILHNLRRLKKVGILPSVSIMVGQFEETKEDVEASINLMLESVRYDPNIQYAFTVVTPFPGSQLYKYIMKNGLLKDDEEFFQKYFYGNGELKRGDWSMVVNLSKMTDEEVLAMYQKINNLYWSEQARMMPWPVKIISVFRKLWRQFNHLFNKVARRLPNEGKWGVVSRVCEAVRDVISCSLEDIELKFRGL